MLNLQGKTRILVSAEFPLALAADVRAEGMLLVQKMEDGVEKVTPSSNATTEKPIGFSYYRTMTPTTKACVERLIATGGKVTLKRAPLAGQLLVKDVASGTVMTAGDPSTTVDKYSISGAVITVHANYVGKELSITYRYSPTAVELMAMDAVSTVVLNAVDQLRSIGVIQQGEVFTDQFDAAIDWTAAQTVKATTGGIITGTAGVGTTLAAATVIKAPTADDPTLGLRFNFVA